MAIIHRATLTPRKFELLNDWLARVPWANATGVPFEQVDSFRFDDPAGKVGIETLLLRAGDGVLLHVPVTYRDAPLAGGEDALIGTLDHSVLGTRYVYDAAADPVGVTAYTATIMTGESNAEKVDVSGDEPTVMQQTASVIGSGVAAPGSIVSEVSTALRPETHGTVTTVSIAVQVGHTTRTLTLALARNIATDGEGLTETTPALNLTGTWQGEAEAQLLAWIPEQDAGS